MGHGGGASDGEWEIKVNLIPLIDMLFNFILFFMCVTEMAKADKAKVDLPVASKADKDDLTPGRMIVNIMKNGDIITFGRTVNNAELETMLALEASVSLTTDPASGQLLPMRAIILRVDEATKYEHVQNVMSACVRHKLWRVAFAAKDPNAKT